MNTKKIFKLDWIISYSIILAFLGAAYLFLNTQKGLEISIKLAQQWIPGNLIISQVNGCLLGPIQIKNLQYKSPKTELSISLGRLDWHWSDLLHGQFHITSLSIDKSVLSIKKENLATSTNRSNKVFFNPIWIFKHIQLGTVDIKQILIHYATNTLVLNGSLHNQWNFNGQLTIPNLETLVPESKGKFVLNGKITGNRLSPEFYLAFPETNLAWNNWQLNQIQGEFHLDSLENKKWFLNLRAKKLKTKTLSLNPIYIDLSGNLQPFSLQGDLYRFNLNRKKENTLHSVNMPSSKITAKLTQLGLETTFISDPTIEDQLNAHIQLPHFQLDSWMNPNQVIKGSIQLTLKNLNYLSNFISILKNPQGLLDTQINFYGPILSPTLDANFNLQKGSVQIPSLGLFLKNISFAFHTDKNLLQGFGQLNSGQGYLTFHSKTQLNKANFLSVIDLQGNNIDISNTQEYKITASPKLKLQADIHHIESTGLIFFPKANININENNLNLVELSNDVVFVTDKKKNISIPFTYKNNIKLQLGNDIRFGYQGLHAKITGALDVNQTTGHPILATGELALTEGKYTYYGQSLKLQPHSLLSFANSPIDNPILDITANKIVWVLPTSTENSNTINSKLGSSNFVSSALQTNQPIQTTVGVHLQGYLANPQITLYADPASAISSQLEILSYLVTGQPSNQLSAASLQVLLNAATHVGGKKTGLNHFIDKAQKKIGIDQLTIGSSPIFNPNTNSLQQNTSLIIGKNLSPRLNVFYSIGILDPISILKINYLLNKNFSLQSTNSTFANGIDLLYKLEKN